MVKDMYVDLEKIEARGKRKKEKSKGLFSSFGKKDEPEPDSEPQTSPEPKVVQAEPPKPVPEPVKKTAPVPQPKPVQEPVAKPAPTIVPPQPAPKPIIVQPAPVQSAPETKNGWKPPAGGKLKKAEDDLLAYKKWLNKGYKSGVMTKEQCVEMVRKKEIELGLRAPE